MPRNRALRPSIFGKIPSDLLMVVLGRAWRQRYLSSSVNIHNICAYGNSVGEARKEEKKADDLCTDAKTCARKPCEQLNRRSLRGMPVVALHIIVFFVVEGSAEVFILSLRSNELLYLSALLFDVEMLSVGPTQSLKLSLLPLCFQTLHTASFQSTSRNGITRLT